MRRAAAAAVSSGALAGRILDAWATNARVTEYLVGGIPKEIWDAPLPGEPRRTIRMLAAHLHNSRCGWLRTLAQPHGLPAPANVDRRRVTRAQLTRALKQSGRAMGGLLAFGIEKGGAVPPTPKYVWRNLPLDVGHVLAYFVAHEGHHRGQLVMLARQLGHRLPAEISNGLWGWNRRSVEGREAERTKTTKRAKHP